jgi:uncharacterized protein YndB with AHSA1/START domain
LFSEYRREARRFVKDNPSGNGLENWAIACYQITHIAEHRSRWVDALNQSRRGSTAVSDDGTEDGEYAEVTRRELISFPWVWASGSSFVFQKLCWLICCDFQKSAVRWTTLLSRKRRKKRKI